MSEKNQKALWVSGAGSKKNVADMAAAMNNQTIKRIEACGWLPVSDEITKAELDAIVKEPDNKATTARLSAILSELTGKDVLMSFRGAGKNNGVIVYGPGCIAQAPKQFAVWLNPRLDTKGLVKAMAIAAACVKHGAFKKESETSDNVKVPKVQYSSKNGVGGTEKVAFTGEFIVGQGIVKVECTDKDGNKFTFKADAEQLQTAQSFADTIKARQNKADEKAAGELEKLKAKIMKMEASKAKRDAKDAADALKTAERKAKAEAMQVAL